MKKLILAAVLMLVPCVCFAQTQTTATEKKSTLNAQTGSSTGVKSSTGVSSSAVVKSSPAKVEAVAETKAETKAVVETKTEAKVLPKAKEAPAQVLVYYGKVDSVAPGDKNTGIPPMIILVAESGEKELFTVDEKTSVTLKGKDIALAEVKKGARAVIGYIVKPVQGFTAVDVKLVE